MPKPATVSLDSIPFYRPDLAPPPPARWGLPTLAGRVAELSGIGPSACLTLAFALVLEAQRRSEPVGWLTPLHSSFFPPDVAGGGVDLSALVVVRLPRAEQLPRAAELLARSGAFALLVLDLGPRAEIPMPMQMRLGGLAQKHDSAVLCLTRKGSEDPSLGSLVSLRGEAVRGPITENERPRRLKSWEAASVCTMRAVKDKRRGPGWKHTEVCRGPTGLR